MTTVRFRGLRARSGPLTDGQGYIWNALRRQPPEDQRSLAVSVHVPEGTALARVTSALVALVTCHESLRTRLVAGPAGETRQEVAGSGSLAIDLATMDDTDAPTDEDPARTWGGGGFDHTTDFPLRTTVVLAGDEPRWIVLTVSHLATDGAGLQVLHRHLTALLRGDDPPAGLSLSCRQPLDQAAYERTPRARARAERALTYWRRQLERFPAFRLPARRPSEPRFWRGTLTSPALATAIPALARRVGRTERSVVLSAVAVAYGRYLDQDSCAITVMCGNRHTPELRDSVMNLPQRVPVVVDLRGPFAQIAGSAQSAVLRAYQHAQYPPGRVRELIGSVAETTGRDLDTDTGFNSVGPTRSGRTPDDTPPHRSFAWVHKSHSDIARLRFFDYFAPNGLSLYTDTGFVPPDDIRAFLTDVEEIILSRAS
ncbi:condensation domain-containing protein [Streptomyces sp. B6B3]|uniref:condensation domain-containing protein n=1 Tax=Streptomyces sp. B6B3 TaxID=3153570 RepID=UPI00325E54B9